MVFDRDDALQHDYLRRARARAPPRRGTMFRPRRTSWRRSARAWAGGWCPTSSQTGRGRAGRARARRGGGRRPSPPALAARTPSLDRTGRGDRRRRPRAAGPRRCRRQQEPSGFRVSRSHGPPRRRRVGAHAAALPGAQRGGVGGRARRCATATGAGPTPSTPTGCDGRRARCAASSASSRATGWHAAAERAPMLELHYAVPASAACSSRSTRGWRATSHLHARALGREASSSPTARLEEPLTPARRAARLWSTSEGECEYERLVAAPSRPTSSARRRARAALDQLHLGHDRAARRA